MNSLAMNTSTKHVFHVVRTGSVAELQELLKNIESEEKAKIANSFNSKQETPLLVAIKRNNLEMVKYLVEEMNADIYKMARFKWKGVDYLKALPLFVAILSDNTSEDHIGRHGSIVNFLITTDTTYDPDAVSYPVMLADIPLAQKIDMLDLIAAAYMLNVISEMGRISMAICLWTAAILLREEESTTCSCSSCLQTTNTFSSTSCKKIFANATEFRTMEELKEIIIQGQGSIFETQALLVAQRVLNGIDPEFPDSHPFFLRRLLQFGEDWFDSSQYNCMVEIVLLILEKFHARQWEDVINLKWCSKLVAKSLISVLYFKWMEREPAPDSSRLPFDSFIVVINYVTDLVMKLQNHDDDKQQKKKTFCHVFISDAIRMFIEHDKEDSQEFKNWLKVYIKFTNSHPGFLTVLHSTCFSLLLPIKTVKLFIDNGADPNAEDEDGDAPLHFVALSKNYSNIAEATKLLLDAGAHLDQGNKVGMTPLDLFKFRQSKLLNQKGATFQYLQELTGTALPLSCLCAKVIRQNRIPFEDLELPIHLVPFIQCHRTEIWHEKMMDAPTDPH